MRGKQCVTCLKWFGLQGFYFHPRAKDGYSNKCKGCIGGNQYYPNSVFKAGDKVEVTLWKGVRAYGLCTKIKGVVTKNHGTRFDVELVKPSGRKMLKRCVLPDNMRKI